MISGYSRTHCICFYFIELTICTSDATTITEAAAVVASVSIFARMYTKQIKSNRIDTICRVCGLARQIARCFFVHLAYESIIVFQMYSLRMLYAKLRSHQTRLCIGWKRTEWIRNQRRKNNNRATYVGCSSIKIATIKYINVAIDDDAAAVVASAAAVDFVLFEIISRFVYFFKEYLFQSAINKSLCLCSALSSSTHSFVHPSYSTDSHPNGWLILLHIFIDTFLNRLGTNRARIKMHTNREKAFGVVMWTNNARCMMIETERVRFFSVAFSVRSFFPIHTLSWSFFAFSSMFRSNVHSYFQKTLFILLHHTST